MKGDTTPELRALKNIFYTTVRIVTKKENKKGGIATGFFYNFQVFDEDNQTYDIELLVTNKHVIKKAKSATIVFHLGPIIKGFPTDGVFEVTIDDFETKFKLHPDPEIDLCAMDISPYFEEVRKKTGKRVYYQALTVEHLLLDDDLKEMFPITDVYMVGYPKGLWDKTNNLPITRRGVTASHPYFDFNKKSQGLVDIAVINGSSGSPIISYQVGPSTYDAPPPLTFKLLGVLWGGALVKGDGKVISISIPNAKSGEVIPVTKVTMHLGFYVKGKELLVFENLFK